MQDENENEKKDTGSGEIGPAEESVEAVPETASGEEATPQDRKPAPSPEGLDPKSILESVLYMEDKPASLDYLSQVIQQTPARTRELMDSLRADYEARGAGVQINEIAHGFILSTAGKLGPYLRHFYSQRNKPAFSRSAVEVLAIIAYKQPITRLEIEAIRGTSVGSGPLRVLLERKLIRIAGRKSVVGHPLLYATTKEFLLYFGLKNLESLPTIREIREMEIS